MGRKGYGNRYILKLLWDHSKECGEPGEVRLPAYALKTKGISDPTARKYLSTLHGCGALALKYDESGALCSAKLLKKPGGVDDEQTTLQIDTKEENKELNEKRENETLKINSTSSDTRNLILLVDYDNVIGHDFPVSFVRVKELVRERGKILFADAFLSPFSTRPRVIDTLNDAGFQCIACSQAYKDKDSVDNRIITRAMTYLERTDAKEIVVVSADRDFSRLVDFAADIHKCVTILNPGQEKESIEGIDAVRTVDFSPQVQGYTEALKALMKDEETFSSLGVEQKANLLTTCIVAIHQIETQRKYQRTFNTLLCEAWPHVKLKWPRSQPLLRPALTCLVENLVLTKHVEEETTSYTLNRQHPVVRKVISSPKQQTAQNGL